MRKELAVSTLFVSVVLTVSTHTPTDARPSPVSGRNTAFRELLSRIDTHSRHCIESYAVMIETYNAYVRGGGDAGVVQGNAEQTITVCTQSSSFFTNTLSGYDHTPDGVTARRLPQTLRPYSDVIRLVWAWQTAMDRYDLVANYMDVYVQGNTVIVPTMIQLAKDGLAAQNKAQALAARVERAFHMSPVGD